jgi:hypothetical protein
MAIPILPRREWEVVGGRIFYMLRGTSKFDQARNGGLI